MKLRFLSPLLAVFLFVPPVLAQETPATREEILRLFDAMKTRDMTRQVMQSMTDQVRSQMRPMDGARNSAASEQLRARIETLVAEMLAEYPMDEIVEDMIPVYQKHLTSTDVDAMVAFYSSPTGQKVIREMPAIVSESMQASQARIQQQMEAFQKKVQEAIREMIQELPSSPGPEI